MDNPDITGENRDEIGRFATGVSGNPSGRPKGSLSITATIRKKLGETPLGSNKAYLEQLVEVLLKKAIEEEDMRAIKEIWSHVDGLPHHSSESNIDMTLPTPILEFLRTTPK